MSPRRAASRPSLGPISTARWCCPACSMPMPISTRATSCRAPATRPATARAPSAASVPDRDGALACRGCAPAHGVRPAMRLRQGRGGDPHASRFGRAAACHHLPGVPPAARRMGRPDRVAALDHRPDRHLHDATKAASLPTGVAEIGGNLGCGTRFLTLNNDPVPPEFDAGDGPHLHPRRGARPRPRHARRRIERSCGAHADPHRAHSRVKRGFKGRILAGHCCALALQTDEFIQRHDGRLQGRRHRHREPAGGEPLPAGARPFGGNEPRRRRAGAASRCCTS